MEHHPGLAPDLIFELLGTESNTIIRKVLEAHFIFALKPEINNKEECTMLQRFLVQSWHFPDFILFDLNYYSVYVINYLR